MTGRCLDFPARHQDTTSKTTPSNTANKTPPTRHHQQDTTSKTQPARHHQKDITSKTPPARHRQQVISARHRHQDTTSTLQQKEPHTRSTNESMSAAMDQSLIHITKAPNTEDKSNNATNSSTSSPFMKLAPELRNAIYEYALFLDDGVIEVSVTAGIPEPALLLTCKEIRREAIGVFYSLNTIKLLIDSYSPAVPLFMHKKQEAILSQYQYKIEVSDVRLEGSSDWRNLLAWLRRYHEADGAVAFAINALGPPLGTDGHKPEGTRMAKELTIVAGLFDMVGHLDGVEWDSFEGTLGMFRYALAEFDEMWDYD